MSLKNAKSNIKKNGKENACYKRTAHSSTDRKELDYTKCLID